MLPELLHVTWNVTCPFQVVKGSLFIAIIQNPRRKKSYHLEVDRFHPEEKNALEILAPTIIGSA